MKKIYIVANWKSNMIESEVRNWLEQVQSSKFKVQSSEKEVVVCPSFISLPILKSYILNHNSSIELGAQDISPFTEGSYTGEINGKQIKEFADYVIIGHSERRKNFGENDEMIVQKVQQAVDNGLVPIICVSDIKQVQSSKFKVQSCNCKCIIAYEPLFAIGSGQADSPENADKIASEIKNIIKGISVLYGGSVTAENVKSFTQMQNIDGVLIGKASLDPLAFLEISKNA